MKTSIQHLIAIAFIALVATGCQSPSSRFYTLNATAKGDGTSAAAYAVAVGPVSIPAAVDRPQFTVNLAPNRVAIDEFNRWAEPLKDNIAHAVAGDLSALLGTPRVVAVPLANLDPTYRVTLDIQRFETNPGKSVEIVAVWVVHKKAGGTISGRTIANEPVSGVSYEELAAAHSRALARVSVDIAAAIRADADAK